MWRSFRHPNILPLLGVTMSETQLAMASEWMTNGNINEFMRAYADADRLGLVSTNPTSGRIYCLITARSF